MQFAGTKSVRFTLVVVAAIVAAPAPCCCPVTPAAPAVAHVAAPAAPAATTASTPVAVTASHCPWVVIAVITYRYSVYTSAADRLVVIGDAVAMAGQ